MLVLNQDSKAQEYVRSQQFLLGYRKIDKKQGQIKKEKN